MENSEDSGKFDRTKARAKRLVGGDRRDGTRGADFSGPDIAGKPTGVPTKRNQDLLRTIKPPPPGPRTPREIRYGLR